MHRPSAVAALAILLVSPAAAQQAPAASQLIPQAFTPAPADAQRAVPDDGANRVGAGETVEVLIADLIVTGLERDAEIDAIAASIRGQRLGTTRIQAVIAAVERLVHQRRPLTRLVVPEQDLRDGAVLRLDAQRLTLVAVDVSAVPDSIRSRVEALLAPLANDPDVSYAQIERRILLAGETPGASLRSSFASRGAGGAVALVIAGAHRAVSAEASIDNTLPAAFGRTQLIANASLNSVFGLGEQIYGFIAMAPQHTWTLDQNPRRIGSVGVQIPIGVDGLSLNLEAAFSTTRPIVASGVLPTKSDFRRWSVRLSHPLVKERGNALTARAVLDIIDDQQKALIGQGLLLSADRFRPIRLGLDWVHTLETEGALSIGGDVSFGIRGLGSRAASEATALLPLSRQGADDVFSKAEFRARFSQPLPLDLTFELSGRLQHSFSGPLLANERMSLGGPRALSSFDAGAFAGDYGWLIRTELQQSWSMTGPAGATAFQPYVFAARGMVANAAPTVLEARRIGASAIGLGFRTGLQASADAPLPRSSEISFEAGYQAVDAGVQPNAWRFTFNSAFRF